MWVICGQAKDAIWGGTREGHVPPLENVKNLGKLFTIIRKYLFE
jgi:hypothetical protein